MSAKMVKAMLQSRPGLADCSVKGQMVDQYLRLCESPISVTATRLCRRGSEAAMGDTQTSERGHVPIKLYKNRHQAGFGADPSLE